MRLLFPRVTQNFKLSKEEFNKISNTKTRKLQNALKNSTANLKIQQKLPKNPSRNCKIECEKGNIYTKLRLSSKYSGSDSGLEALTRLARVVVVFFGSFAGLDSSFLPAFLLAVFLIGYLFRELQKIERERECREREK